MKGRRIDYSRTDLRFIDTRGSMPRRELHAAFVAKFGRRDVTAGHIQSLCKRRGLKLGRRRFSADDDRLMRELYPDMATLELAERLGRSLSSVYQRARALGLEKSDAYLASPAACRLRRGDNIGAAYRFQKGQAPPNKGLRRPGWAAGRMQITQFKAGQTGWNWKPIGSERLVDGYHYTKVSDHRRVPWTRNWKPTHVLRWEAIYGALPKGTALKNLDGNRRNIDPSNWTPVPRALLPRLNGGRRGGSRYDGAPADLKPTILAVAKLEHAAREARKRVG